MKLQVALIVAVVAYIATIDTVSSQDPNPAAAVGALLPLDDTAVEHQPESYLEPSDGLVRNKRQYGRGYGGYGGGFRGGYGGYRGGYGGYRGGYGGYRGGYGGFYGR